MKTYNYILISSLFIAISLSSCKKDEPAPENQINNNLKVMISEHGQNPDEADVQNATARRLNGFIYTESNAAGQNEILCYHQHLNGSLTFIQSVPSGGNGTGMPLGSQGALAFSSNHRMLFAVNAGSNTISSFEIGQNGLPLLVQTISSMGQTPVSIAVRNHLIYVVNAGSSDIAGFEFSNGMLTPITNSVKSLSAANAGPAQISFAPNGSHLYVTEKMTNIISVFPVLPNGQTGNRISITSTGTTPFGYEFARNRFMIVSNASGGAPNASTVTSYQGANSGNLVPVSGPLPNNQSAACWVTTTNHGRFAYVTNTGSDNISSYYISPSGNLHLIAGNAGTTDDMPLDIVVASNNFYVYTLCSNGGTIVGHYRNLFGTLSANGSVGGIPASASGLVRM
jgi:6-phosphogluconolactonase (cycloisomerase 2 family)